MPVSAVSIASGTYTPIGVSATGTSPTQGSGTGYTGPWRVETQELTIEYVRVPVLGSPVISGESLSGTTTSTRTVTRTQIQAKVNARVKVVKTYDTYTTSSFQQSQKFVVAAEMFDALAIPYGALSDGGELCMGPAGKVLTDIPYYSRRAWDDNVDVEIDQNFTGHTVAFKPGHYIAGFAASATPFDERFGSYLHVNNPLMAGALQSNYNDTTFMAPVDFYNIVGSYQTNKEADALVRSYVDSIGSRVPMINQFYTEQPNLSPGIAAMPLKEATPATFYKVDRHDWS